jgi:hypothetical protein
MMLATHCLNWSTVFGRKPALTPRQWRNKPAASCETVKYAKAWVAPIHRGLQAGKNLLLIEIEEPVLIWANLVDGQMVEPRVCKLFDAFDMNLGIGAA